MKQRPRSILRAALLAISGALASQSLSRVASARIAQFKLLGRVVEGSTRYRSLCPKGAGHGPRKHTMAQRNQVGSRAANRASIRFVKGLRYTPWGQQFS